MLNHITIMGRIAKDIELRRTGTGVAVASFTVACDRDFGQDGQKETDFIDCVAWRGTAEFVDRPCVAAFLSCVPIMTVHRQHFVFP